MSIMNYMQVIFVVLFVIILGLPLMAGMMKK